MVILAETLLGRATRSGQVMTRCRSDQTILDLVRVPVDRSKISAKYEGICW